MNIDKFSVAIGTVIGASMIFVGNAASRVFSDGLFSGISVMIAWVCICFLIISIIENRKKLLEDPPIFKLCREEKPSPMDEFYKKRKLENIKKLEDKYPKFKESSKIQKWIDLYMKIKFDSFNDESRFLKTFEDVISGVDK